jgi:hypothetical protein
MIAKHLANKRNSIQIQNTKTDIETTFKKTPAPNSPIIIDFSPFRLMHDDRYWTWKSPGIRSCADCAKANPKSEVEDEVEAYHNMIRS